MPISMAERKRAMTIETISHSFNPNNISPDKTGLPGINSQIFLQQSLERVFPLGEKTRPRHLYPENLQICAEEGLKRPRFLRKKNWNALDTQFRLFVYSTHPHASSYQLVIDPVNKQFV
jgi:hypothetical protein